MAVWRPRRPATWSPKRSPKRQRQTPVLRPLPSLRPGQQLGAAGAGGEILPAAPHARRVAFVGRYLGVDLAGRQAVDVAAELHRREQHPGVAREEYAEP